MLLGALNAAIDDDGFSIGPSYFITRDGTLPDLDRIWTNAIMPLLRERYYGTTEGICSRFELAALRRRLEAMRIELTAWSEAVVDLPAEIAAALARSGLTDVRLAEPPGQWRLVTDYGLFSRRLGCAGQASGPRRRCPVGTPCIWRVARPGLLFDVEHDLFAAVAYGFALHAERAISPAPLRGYVAIEEREFTLRGRVRIGDQLGVLTGSPDTARADV